MDASFYSRQINVRMIELRSCLKFYSFDPSVSPDIPCEERSKLATGGTPVRRKVKDNSFVILIRWISWLTSWQKNDNHTLNASIAGLLLPPLSTKVTFWSNSITSTICNEKPWSSSSCCCSVDRMPGCEQLHVSCCNMFDNNNGDNHKLYSTFWKFCSIEGSCVEPCGMVQCPGYSPLQPWTW